MTNALIPTLITTWLACGLATFALLRYTLQRCAERSEKFAKHASIQAASTQPGQHFLLLKCLIGWPYVLPKLVAAWVMDAVDQWRTDRANRKLQKTIVKAVGKLDELVQKIVADTEKTDPELSKKLRDEMEKLNQVAAGERGPDNDATDNIERLLNEAEDLNS